MKSRIWELDALRGLCILGVIVVHFVYDITTLYRLVDWTLPDIFLFVQQWGGTVFLLISGICATLGSRSVRRGIIVFCCGLLCSAVTAGMYFLGMADKGIIIYFGVLHCLGTCMIVWPLFKKMHPVSLIFLSAALVAIGFVLADMRSSTFWLVPIGLTPHGFASSDYFPLLPNLGFFLFGAVLGKLAYRSGESLLPKVNSNSPILKFLQLCGKHSLWIYLLHQPILNGICWLLMLA